VTDTTSDRRADRFPVPLRVLWSFERVEGTAALINISYTGALLENTEMRPVIGTPINLYLYLEPPRGSAEAEKPSELAGTVSRHSPDGFAVKFDNSYDPDLIEVVDHAAAVVDTRR